MDLVAVLEVRVAPHLLHHRPGQVLLVREIAVAQTIQVLHTQPVVVVEQVLQAVQLVVRSVEMVVLVSHLQFLDLVLLMQVAVVAVPLIIQLVIYQAQVAPVEVVLVEHIIIVLYQVTELQILVAEVAAAVVLEMAGMADLV
jgi:hypothetical protein